MCLFLTRYSKDKQKTSPQDKHILVRYIRHHVTTIKDLLDHFSFFPENIN